MNAPLSPAAPVPASTTSALLSALRVAKAGDVIVMAPGRYAGVQIKGLKFDGVVTIQGPGAVLADLMVRDCKGLAFVGFVFEIDPAGLANQFQALASEDVHLSDLDVHCPALEAATAKIGGLLLRDSRKVSVTGSKFHDLVFGVSLLDCDGVVVSNNRFHDLQTDGVRGSATNVRIDGNHFTDFYPAAGDHPDAIQLWTTNTTVSARAITITGNVVERGKGAPVQGIFLRDQVGGLPYIDVRIANNLVVGGLYNGIMVDGGDGVVIEGNTVTGFPDQKSWVRMQRVEGLTLISNVAEAFLLDGKEVEAPGGNRLIPAATDRGAALIAAWTGLDEPPARDELRELIARRTVVKQEALKTKGRVSLDWKTPAEADAFLAAVLAIASAA